MKIEILNLSKERCPRKFIQIWLDQVARKLKLKNQTLNIIFVSPKKIKDLNKKYRKKNYATDILSFQSDAFLQEKELGELVLSLKVIRKQAKEHGLSFQEELGYLLLHGVLHLLGYEHENSPKKAKIMFSLQDRLFEQLTNK